MSEASRQVYRVSNFSCTGCANKFEKNVQKIEGVEEAKVNFGALKLTVYGTASVEEIERAGAFENIKIAPEKEGINIQQESFLKQHSHILVSLFFVLMGYLSQSLYGEGSSQSIMAFGAGIVIGGFSLFKVGLKNLIHLEFDMKTLMTIAIIGAAIIGEWSEGAVVVILFAISEVLESYSMQKARQSIRSLMDIAPKEALVRRNGKEVLVQVNDIQIGDVMIVKPGQKIAMDGMVQSGISSVNQAAITGESVPVEKGVNDEVFAGTLNEEGLLEVIVTRRVEDTTISKIIHLVEEAQAERAPSQAFIEKFARYYTPIIIVIAFLAAVLPPLFFDASWSTWVYQGLSVLVVGCPCALVISTPVAIVTAIGHAAKKGVLIKGGVFLEEMGSLKAIAFDKTGTLTKGVPVVTDFIVIEEGCSENEMFAILTALENRSQHPLASSIMKKAEQEGILYKSIPVEQFSSLTGRGIKGIINGEWYHAGSPAYIAEVIKKDLPADIKEGIEELQYQGKTVMVLGTSLGVAGLIAVADEVRENSRSVISQLHTLGIEKTFMLTGDNIGTAKAISQKVGVSSFKAELLPQDKLVFIKALRKDYNRAAMVGDGVNDAPALAASTVGIAMGGAGTDTALETADVALMGDDLSKLPFTIRLSRKALMIIKQNITFSIGIKLFALLLVIPGWLTLWIAIFADMGATILVTLNSLRLLRLKDK
ncbi:Cd2+/Zn2+-exporting ATPase [Peribacillus deserti]|uniref:Cd(2+)-exporting ATPase n=1 Tax=Peribacillus deserti TaxID=673318 RepID=A0ABS2QMX9_9BACI|nr:Cd2+/Zn2+-exporting ATPase [Peribacillus deserti]